MTKVDATKLLAYLAAHYPSVSLPDETVAIWQSNLAEFTIDAGEIAARRVVNKHKWFPSWSEFREALICGDAPSAEEAWGMAMNTGGFYLDNKEVKKAVAAVGGSSSLKTCPDRYWVAKTFKASYSASMAEKHEEEEKRMKGENLRLMAGAAPKALNEENQ